MARNTTTEPTETAADTAPPIVPEAAAENAPGAVGSHDRARPGTPATTSSTDVLRTGCPCTRPQRIRS